MLIVLEGCDGSGKSTLAQDLAKILDAEIIHCSAKTPNNKEFFEGIIESSRYKNIIADRFCYGQFVYQPEGERPLGYIHDLNMLELKMLDIGTKVIFVEAPNEIIENRLAAREEKCINGLTVPEIQQRFIELFDNFSLFSENYIRWDTYLGMINRLEEE